MNTVDFAVLTPLPIEWEAVKRRLKDAEEPSSIYPTAVGHIGPYRVVVRMPPEVGGYQAADMTRLVVTEWRPRWVVLVGVAAGFAEHLVNPGDVVIASKVYAYEYGKIDKGRFVRRDKFDFAPDPSWMSFVKVLVQTEAKGRYAWTRRIGVKRPFSDTRRPPKAHIGPIASGEKVVDDPTYEFFADAISSLPDLSAVEMEGAGAGASINNLRSEYQVGFFMIRGISDIPRAHALENGQPRGTLQRDAWKPYAAAAAAAFFECLLTMPGAPPVTTHGTLPGGPEVTLSEPLREFDLGHFKYYVTRLEEEFHEWWQLYVPLMARDKRFPFSPQVRRWPQTPHLQANQEPYPIFEAMTAQRHLVVVGEGGVGKTTVLRWLALQDVQRVIRAEQDARVPVYVELNAYKGDLVTLVRAKLGLARLEEERLERYLTQGRFAFYFDGLNEVADKWRDDAISDLKQFCARFVGNQIAVTTRSYGYNDELALPAVEVQLLGRKQVLEVVERYFSEDAESASRLLSEMRMDDASEWERPNSLINLVRNALHLWFMIEVFREYGELPKSRGRLFERFVEWRLSKWEEQYGKKRRFDYHDKLPVLARLAFDMIDKRMGTRVSWNMALSICVDQYGSEGRLLLREVLRNGILREVDGDVEWMHQLIAEYLAAVAIRDMDDVAVVRELAQVEYGFKWQNPVVLLTGISHAPGRVMLEVAKAITEPAWLKRAKEISFPFAIIRLVGLLSDCVLEGGSAEEHDKRLLAQIVRGGLRELEDPLPERYFRYVQSEKLAQTIDQLSARHAEGAPRVARIAKELGTRLAEAGVEAELRDFPRDISSCVRKMERRQIPMDDIKDTERIVVVVGELSECYEVLGIIHSLWEPVPGEFDDYVAAPKEGPYMSLHTTVNVGGRTLAFYIRTRIMDHVARYGPALWRRPDQLRHVPVLHAQVVWLLEYLEAGDLRGSEIDPLVQFVMPSASVGGARAEHSRIYVITPKLDVVELPHAATPIDFAYKIHTEVGHNCRGAKVNGHPVSLRHQLRTGDRVEIVTTEPVEPEAGRLGQKVGVHAVDGIASSMGSKGPSLDWLDPRLGYVRTSHARRMIRRWFRKLGRGEAINKGRQEPA